MVTGAVARAVPLPWSLKAKVQGKIAYRRRRAGEEVALSVDVPDCFLLECYNPNATPVQLTFTVRPREAGAVRAFQNAICVPSGFVRDTIALDDIRRIVDLAQPFEVEIVPNEADDTVLYFGLLDFVRLSTSPAAGTTTPAPPIPTKAKPAKIWKCVVWDLDNTLWDGILIEDGPEGIRLRPDVVDVIKQLDQRGILQSIASKNNETDAMSVLQASGLDGYFLYPQISWGPKSQALTRIAQLMNIGVDSLAFVDDQPFEREEVASVLPQVAVIDSVDAGALPARTECQVPITDESRQRRLMYRQEEQRERIFGAFQGDYVQFLRDCRIELELSPLSTDNVERVYELAQRTNQMNFSGARYSRAQLEELQRSPVHETYVIRCTDRFGSYGIVGFAVVERQEPRLLDLMFSCRIQGKHVDVAFLAHVLEKFAQPERQDFFANFRKTDKNVAAGQVFEDMGFEVVGQQDGVLSLGFLKARAIPREGIVQITETGRDR
jgi:FkbH-like protein